jgi:DNA-binding response OmpR family regulator
MPKILVVEDEKNLRLLYKGDLEQEGYSVVTAGNAADGLEVIEKEAPDLVVLDIRLPGMDGIEAMGRVLGRYPRMPIILNSAYSSYKDNFLSWAADAYVIKSSDTTELKNKIRELLAVRQTDQPMPREQRRRDSARATDGT